MAVDALQIEGWREVNRSLRQIGGDLPKASRLAANDAATIVITAAKPLVPSGPAKGGHAANTLKARSTREAVIIQGGSKKNPYYPWLDFGGAVGRNNSVQRPFLKKGRYIWAAYGDNHERVAQRLYDNLAGIVADAGLTLEATAA